MSSPVIALAYANGTMVEGSEGTTYDGPEPQLFKMRPGITLDSLKQKLHSVLKLQSNQQVLTVRYRFPIVVNRNMKYKAIPLNDDIQVECMFDAHANLGDLGAIELYVEIGTCEMQCEDVRSQSQFEASPSNNSTPNGCGTQRESEFATDAEMRAFSVGEPSDPGPVDRSVRYLQDYHCSQAVRHGQGVLRCRHSAGALQSLPDPRFVPYLRQSGFYGVARLGFVQLDHHLITALVERWSPETHTFDLPQGECTVTLQDVAIHLGLPIDGAPVTGQTSENWPSVCQRLLGVTPPAGSITGQALNMSWLAEHFGKLPEDADKDTVKRHVRAHILRLIGGSILVDKSSDRVQLMYLPLLEDFAHAGSFSWGSACLAWLYRELCHATNIFTLEIGGPLILLQLWAWDRLPHIAPLRRGIFQDVDAPPGGVGPVFPPGPLSCRWRDCQIVTNVPTPVLRQYRYLLDHQSPAEMVWMPYSEDIIRGLPDYCLSGSNIWCAVVPLICFHIVEWHRPDRVLRQFGLQQPTPNKPKLDDGLHSIDLSGRCDISWPTKHSSYIAIWEDRHHRVVTGQTLTGQLILDSEYMRWYWGITRHWVSPLGAALGSVADGVERIYRLSGQDAQLSDFAKIQNISKGLLKTLDEYQRLDLTQSAQPAPPPIEFTDPLMPQSTKRQRGLQPTGLAARPRKNIGNISEGLLKVVHEHQRLDPTQSAQPAPPPIEFQDPPMPQSTKRQRGKNIGNISEGLLKAVHEHQCLDPTQSAQPAPPPIEFPDPPMPQSTKRQRGLQPTGLAASRRKNIRNLRDESLIKALRKFAHEHQRLDPTQSAQPAPPPIEFPDPPMPQSTKRQRGLQLTDLAAKRKKITLEETRADWEVSRSHAEHHDPTSNARSSQPDPILHPLGSSPRRTSLVYLSSQHSPSLPAATSTRHAETQQVTSVSSHIFEPVILPEVEPIPARGHSRLRVQVQPQAQRSVKPHLKSQQPSCDT